MYKIIGSGLCIMYIVGNIWPIGFLISKGYIPGAFAVLSFGPSVWGVDFLFPISFSHFQNWIFHFQIRIFCAEFGFFVPNTVHTLPPDHGARKVYLYLFP